MNRAKLKFELQLIYQCKYLRRQHFSSKSFVRYKKKSNDGSKSRPNGTGKLAYDSERVQQTRSNGAPTSKETQNLLSELFISPGNIADTLSGYFRKTNLESQAKSENGTSDIINKNTEILETSTYSVSALNRSDPFQQRKEDSVTKGDSATISTSDLVSDRHVSSNVLYWPCGTLTFLKSDFLRIMPKLKAQLFNAEDTQEQSDLIYSDPSEFQVVRSRDPETLTRWIGYFLVFPSPRAARKYYLETKGAELCGLQVAFSFVDADKLNIRPPVLNEVPNISRDMCALISGLPPQMNKLSIAQALWDYNLIDTESKAIVQLSGGEHELESSWLVRFKDTMEPKRLRRRFHLQPWPNTTSGLTSVEILD